MVDTPRRRVKTTQEGTEIPDGFDPGSYVKFIDRKHDDQERQGRVESVGNRELLVAELVTGKMYVVLWEDAQPTEAPKGAARSKKGADKPEKKDVGQQTLA